MQINDLETPVAVVDLSRLEANITRLQAYLDRHGIKNRPHIKTHKIPEIARMQVKAGATGVTCQKLGEAEVMADAGIEDIFLPYNLLGGPRLERLVALNRRVRLAVTADSDVVVRGLSGAMERAGDALCVLVECDTGMGRCGVTTVEGARDLAGLIARSPGLKFGGLMTFPSSPAAEAFMREAKAALGRAGLKAETVSGGGTPPVWQAHTFPSFTEHRAGMYVYGDRFTMRSGAMKLEECSFTVIATVVSRPTPGRGVLDAGSKTLSSDLIGLEGHGLILEHPEARIQTLSEEHAVADFSACPRRPAIGERVTVIPNHCCVVSNLFDRIVAARAGKVETEWRVAARGHLT